MSVVQAFAAEGREFEKFKKINKEHRNANIKAIFAYSVFFPLVEIVLALSIGLVVWWTSKEALNLHQSQQGTVISFILCLNLLFRPLRVIADKFNVLQRGIIASERVFKVLDNEDFTAPDPANAYAPAIVKGKIDFENVVFEYNPGVPVLKNVSFSVNPVAHQLPDADIEMFVLYFPPGSPRSLDTSLAVERLRVAVVNAEATRAASGWLQVALAHELLHTAGASDKYGATGAPLAPHGLGEPDKSPLYPQEFCEIMAGQIAQGEGQFREPPGLDACVVGSAPAAEIRWRKGP